MEIKSKSYCDQSVHFESVAEGMLGARREYGLARRGGIADRCRFAELPHL